MLIVVPARGGSKGVPGKNIRILNGKPLIQYTLEAALEIVPRNQIIVSTDSLEIKNVVEKLGFEVPFLRPIELATDTAGTYEVLLHALDYYGKCKQEADEVVLLQPTSPFRTAEHIREALNLYTPNLDMVVSVKETASNPYYVLREENEEGFLVKSKEGQFTRRQDCPKVWELNGAIYIINKNSLLQKPLNKFQKVIKYVMDDVSSHDIDSEWDWKLAELMK